MGIERNFSCEKCRETIEEWDRTPESENYDFKCPNCGKPHSHLQTEAFEELIPVDKETGEPQNTFTTTAGRKIHGIEQVQTLLLQSKGRRKCRNCKSEKRENWKYRSSPNYDLKCPECGQKHIEDTNKLIPVNDEGERQNVLTIEGRTFIGEEEIQEALEKLKERKGGGS